VEGVMKKVFLAAAAALAVGTACAGAADLGVPRAAVQTCPAPLWAGFYVGGNAGGVIYSANRTDQDGVLGEIASYVQQKSGAVAGGQVGYNWTSCHVLYGVEVDGDWASPRASTQIAPNTAGINVNISSRFDGLVTGRLRTGIAVDSLLLYLTGGIAGVHIHTTWSSLGLPAALPGVLGLADFSEWQAAWVTGVGTEWAWTDRISIRSEVLYIGVPDREKSAVLFAPGVLANFTHSDSMWVSRVGLNIKLP
jgi:outer membrane immunogenic protein